MSVERILQNDINDSERWIDKADGVYKRELAKRIELINWVLENMKNPDNNICKIIEFKMDEILIKKKPTVFLR
jgi:hypothetical protein